MNQKIDPSYLKKNNSQLPFYELLVSRKSTFEEVLRDISQTLNENPKRGRLWIEDQIISGAKLEESLENYGISMGQVVYAEYATAASNLWPSDNLIMKQSASGKGSKSNGGATEDGLKTNGLYNLGNSKFLLNNK